MDDETELTAAIIWQEYKDALMSAGRLSESDVILLRWLRPRWDGSFKLCLDYADCLDLDHVAAILNRNLDIWQLLPYSFDFGWGEPYHVGPESPMEIHSTDLGNAGRLVARYGAILRYCHPWAKWLVWDSKRWKVDDTAEVSRCAKETVRAIYVEAGEAEKEGDRKDLARHAMRSESRERIKAMVDLAASESGIPILPDQLDADPWLLNCANGTVDLRDGLLREHRQDDFITKLANTAYDPDAGCPLWLKFLDEIMAGDQAMIAFLQRAIGYSLTGDISERAFFVMYGTGANGKTTFLEVIRALLGDYALRTPTETLMVKRSGNIPNDVARLRGARFVSASESEEGRRLAESFIKDLTGRDTMTARFMRAEWFDFVPECKIWLATNHKPEVRGTDRAIWDRIRLIPFEVSIPEDKQDRRLADKLKAELPGILAWAVRGCLDWQRDGLGVAEKVKTATAAYQLEMDILGQWIADCCTEGQDKEALASDLYESYKAYSGELNQTRFGRALRERGFEREKRGGRIYWHGLGLLAGQLGQLGPNSHINVNEQNSLRDNRENCPELSYCPGDDPVIQAAQALGGEVEIKTPDGMVRMPF